MAQKACRPSRRRCVPNAAIPLILSSCLGTVQAQQIPPTVWTASSLARIWQNSPAGSSNQIAIYAAKDETYSFQIGIQTPSGRITNVTASTTGLTGPSGTISGSDIVFYREQYVSVAALPGWLSGGTNPPSGAGMYPDGLMPFVDDETGNVASGGALSAQPFTVAPGINEVLWIDVHVPPSYAAGTYTGTVVISSDNGSSSSKVTLHVWNFALPKVPTYKSSIQASSAGNRNDLMARELLRNRQSPAWSISTRALESQYIDEYGLNSVGMFMGTGWYGANCQGSSPSTPMAMPSVSQFASAYSAHDPRLVIYNFLADEVYPDPPQNCAGTYPTLVQWARNMHMANSNEMSLLSVSPEGPATAPLYNDGLGHTAVDIWTILPTMYQQHTAEIQAREGAGDSMWLYNVLVQDDYSPKQNINWGSLDWRLSLGYISASVGFKGWQQWSVDTWSKDPWNTVSGASGANADVPADGMSMYPGSTVGITGYAPSMRIKWSRDGINDFEYVQILKNLGQDAWAKTQIAPIAHDFANWTRDYTQVEAVRIALGNKIDQLSGGSPIINSPSITSSTSAQASTGKTFSYQITASNNPTGFSATGLPAGLNFYQATGLISGTPTTAGIYQVAIGASNNGGTGSAMLTVTVSANEVAGHQIALFQSNSVGGSNQKSVLVQFRGMNISGNLIVAFVRMSTTTQTVKVTDTAGNIYVQAANQKQIADGSQIYIFYARNIAGRINTVTATFSSTNNHPWLAVFEYSGLSKTSPLDRIATAQGNGSSIATGASEPTTSPTELIFAAAGLPASFAGTASSGSGYSFGQQDTGSSRAITEAAITSAAASYSATFALSSRANWSAVLATFRQ